MAVLWTLKDQPYTAFFDRTTLLYRCTRRYVVSGVVPSGMKAEEVAATYTRWVTGAVTDRPPSNITVQHTGFWLHQTDGGSIGVWNVMMHSIGMRVVNVPSKDIFEVDVDYMGRVPVTIGMSTRVQMLSRIRRESLTKNADDTYDMIGTHGEGVAVDVPAVMYIVVNVIPYADYDSMIDLENVIAGAVNEANWAAPWLLGSSTYPQGEFVYLGPQEGLVDRRTKTVEIHHAFMRKQYITKQHIYLWLNRDQSISDDGHAISTYGPNWIDGKILKIAGTDKYWWGVGDEADAQTIPPFSALLLTPPII